MLTEQTQVGMLPVELWNSFRLFKYTEINILRKQFKFSMPIDHTKYQPKDDKLSLKWAWSRHVIHFKFQGPKHTSKITEARIVKFLTQVGYI